MTRFVALLRGVNLGRNKRVSMADLRRIAEDLGFDAVATYLQSGNVLFDSPSKDAANHARRIEKALLEELGLSSKVLIRDGAEMRAVENANPFAAAAARDPTKVHVGFLSA